MIGLFKKLFSASSKTANSVENALITQTVIDETSINETVKALWLQAETAHQEGDLQKAFRLASLALDIEPNNPELLLQMGALAFRLEQQDEAIDYLLTAVHLKENFAEAYHQLAKIYHELGNQETTREFIDRAIVCQPDNPELICDFGLTKVDMDEFEEAINLYQRAIEIRPDYAFAYINLGHALIKQNREKEALLPTLIAHVLDPTLIEPLINLSKIYYTLGNIPAAHRATKQILRLDPDNHAALVFLFWHYALYGKFDKAWPIYHYRFSLTGGAEVERRDFRFPEWQGEPLAGKSILIIAEQGLGDQIMFLSCLPELIAMAGTVIVECAPKLKGLFQHSFPDALFLASQYKTEESVTEIVDIKPNYQIHMGDLPFHFRPRLSSFDQVVASPYLLAQPEKTTYWRTRLSALPASINIGISWRGGVTKTRSRLRSIALENWLPILQLPNINFINLQYGDCQADLEACQAMTGVTVHHWPEMIADYQETAALLYNLDLVISVCTSVIHLAGALAVPTRILVPSSPEWRYMAHGERMPWYPSIRLCRQAVDEEWPAVIARVQADLVRKLDRFTEDDQIPA